MSKKNKITLLGVLAFISTAFVIIVLALYVNKFSARLSPDQADWAGFGSYVGGTLGTVFAFASFWVLFQTFGSQQKQAKNNELQKFEQAKNNELQKFETTFYSLLELHNQSLRELKPNMDTNKLNTIFNCDETARARSIWSDMDASLTLGTTEKEVNKKVMYRLEITQKNIRKEVEISQYFRILYQLLKFVAKYNILNTDHRFDEEYLDNKKNISEESEEYKEYEKYEKMYTSLVRAFVPVKLLPILALNGIPTDTDDELHNLDKYKKLLDRYQFLEHIQLNSLPDSPTTFLILKEYDRALGKNKDIEVKIESIQLKLPYLFVFDSMKEGYLTE